jgi:hypothetical protein
MADFDPLMPIGGLKSPKHSDALNSQCIRDQRANSFMQRTYGCHHNEWLTKSMNGYQNGAKTAH